MNKVLSLVLSLFCTSVSAATWTLDEQHSTLHFLSTKNEHVTETHTFTELSGQLNNKGDLQVTVSLASVDTGIEIRDDRMRSMLFDLVQFPTATLSASLDSTLLDLKPGQQQSLTVSANLAMNGKTQTQPMHVVVTRLSGGGFHATNSKPIVLNAASFEYTEGLGKLREIVGLTSISLTVPVSFSVVFQPE